MKVLRGTLTFVLGMIIGIILFVVAIGGAAFIIASSVSVGQLQDQVGGEIFEPDSEIIDKTVLEVVTDLVSDIQNIDKLTINTLKTKYGLKIPSEISGIDISPVFDEPLLNVPNALGKIVNNVTLNDIGELTGIDFNDYGVPVIKDNLYQSVTATIETLLATLNDASSLSIRDLQQQFGVNLGDNGIIDAIADVPLNQFANLMMDLPIGTVIDIDEDLFLPVAAVDVYLKADRREPVDIDNLGTVKDGALSYIAGSKDGNVIYRELLFREKEVKGADGTITKEWIVDNSPYSETFDKENNSYVYYRYIEYELLADNTAAEPTEFFIKSYRNVVDSVDGGEYKLREDGYVSLSSFYKDSSLTSPLAADVTADGKLSIPSAVYYDNSGAQETGEAFGFNPDEAPSVENVLQEGFDGYVRYHKGADAAVLQKLSGYTIGGINGAVDEITSLKLKEIIDIDVNSPDTPQILKTLAEVPVCDLSEQINSLTLADVTEIVGYNYEAAANGKYAFIPASTSYELFDENKHDAAAKRYSYSYAASDNGEYMMLDGKYYLYRDGFDTQEGFGGRFDRVFAEDSNGNYVRVQKGYYTPYNAAEHGEYARYNLSATQPDNAAAAVLQRLAALSVGDFGTAFNDITVGDVAGIDFDVFEKTVVSGAFDSDTVYYEYDGGLYSETEDLIPVADKTYYVRAFEGTGNAVMKKLVFIGINDIGAKMDAVIDSLYLDEVLTVVYNKYDEAPDGAYVKVGNYYTLYNPANKNHEGLQRYNLSADQPDNVASKAIQRLARVKINDMASAFDKLLLSEVMELKADVFEDAQGTEYDSSRTYYEYKAAEGSVNGYFAQAENVTEDNYLNYYYVGAEGEGNAVLKKMAWLTINDMSAQMTGIINDTYIHELIEIHDKATVTSATDAAEHNDYFVPYRPEYSVVDSEGSVTRYGYVLDSEGGFYATESVYLPATEKQLTAGEEKAYYYKKYVDSERTADNLAKLLSGELMLYYKNTSGEYIYNPTVAARYFIKTSVIPSYTPEYIDLYERTNVAQAGETAITGKTYSFTNGVGENLLYVNTGIAFIQYDSANLAHMNMPLYVLYEGGLYPASADNIAAYKNGSGKLYDINGAEITTYDDAKQYYVKLNEIETGKYYFCALDGNYDDGGDTPENADLKYSMVLCEEITVDGNAAYGYLARSRNNVYAGDSKIITNAVAVSVDVEASSAVLRAFKRNNVKIGTLDNAIKNMKLSDVIDVAPGSILDLIKNKTLSELDSATSTLFTEMTVPEMLQIAKIPLDSSVSGLLTNVTLSDFFGALTVSTPENQGSVPSIPYGTLYVDFAKLFDVTLVTASA